MRDALDRGPLERVLQLSIAALIVLTVLSQGSLVSWLDVARKLRWAALFGFVAVALAYAYRRGGLRRLGFVHAAAAALIALAAVSTAWSSFPKLTFERAAALGILFAGCGAVAAGVTDSAAVRRIVDAILAGAAAVGVGGLLVLVFAHDRAVQPATSVLPARYQGLGGGPNTAMMMLAVALPLAVYALLEARRGRPRAAALAVTLLLLGSIVASGSRGAIAGAFGGLFVLGVAASTTWRQRALAVAGVATLFVVAVAVTRIPDPNPTAAPLPSASEPPPTQFHGPRATVPEAAPRLQDDIGRPPYGVGETARKPRTLFGSSGRAQAWDGALHLGLQRPLAGFGFGTEDRVFVDRYADFNSNVPENSYLGLFLQLGFAGLVAFVAFAGTALAAGAARLRSARGAERHLTAALAGALAAGLLLAGFQSYLYAVGNNATAAVWLAAFLLAAPLRLPRARRAFLAVGGVAFVLAALVGIGILERAHRADDQSHALRRAVAEIGPLDSPQLDQYRYFSPQMQCLLYRRGRDPFALELCADTEGRVVETIDRRSAPKPQIHSLRDDPSRSDVRVDREEVTRLVHAMGVPLDWLPQERR